MTNNLQTSDRSRYRVPILDRALALVELLGSHPGGLNATELCEALAIPKNSAFRIAVTLEENGYLERLEPSKKYRLTSRFMTVGATSVSELNLFEKSLDVMRSLRDELKETVLLGTLTGCEGVVLDQVPGIHAFRFSVDPGTRFVLHTAAPGKAILAYLPEEERRKIVAQMEFTHFTENTILNREEFLAHLVEVRERGYGFDLSEEREGQYCVGAPIFNGKSEPIAALWITAPSSRLPDCDLDEVACKIRDAADVVSSRLGWNSEG
ncbi:IclR family transcriptional regulator [Akkermansiaceae bacterium]|nr:IclR family transcriptional regulator [Akkermansiaceae bacterium]